jgi:hypothetical protein
MSGSLLTTLRSLTGAEAVFAAARSCGLNRTNDDEPRERRSPGIGSRWSQWWPLAIGPIVILTLGVLASVALVSSTAPSQGSGYPTAVLTGITTLVSVETFLVGLGLNLGRSDVYKQVAEELISRDSALLSAMEARPPAVSVGGLFLEFALDIQFQHGELDRAVEVTRRIGRHKEELEAKLDFFSKYRPGRQLLLDLSAALRPADTRLIVAAFLTATAATLAMLGSASAGWGWRWPPDPVFWALAALIVTAVCVLAVAFQARSAEADRAVKQLGQDHFVGLRLAELLAYPSGAHELVNKRAFAVESDEEWVRRVLITRPNNRYARVLLAAIMIDAAAADEFTFRQTSSNDVALWSTLREPHIPKLQAARALLDPLMARRSMPDHVLSGDEMARAVSAGWTWAVPDTTVALLRARAGELLGEPSEVLTALLDAAAAWRTSQNPLVGELTVPSRWLVAKHLLPTRTMPDVALRFDINSDEELLDHPVIAQAGKSPGTIRD